MLIIKVIRLVVLIFGISSAAFFSVQYGFAVDHADIATKYRDFLTGLSRMDLGISTVSGQPVLVEIMSRWPATIELGAIAMLVSIIIGVTLGVIAAVNQNKLVDRFLISVSLIGYSIPSFWFALILILFLSVGLDLTPVSGRLDVMYDVAPVTGFMLVDTLLDPVTKQFHFEAFYSAVSHLLLPVMVLASVPTAVFARMTRSCMLEILSKDFILSAHARGLSKYRIVLIHGLRNALTSLLSVGGIHFIMTVVMGSIVIEVIFGWPGIGSYIIQSIYARDYSVVQIFLLSMGIVVLIVNTLIDLLIYLLNPRTLRT